MMGRKRGEFADPYPAKAAVVFFLFLSFFLRIYRIGPDLRLIYNLYIFITRISYDAI